LVYRNRQGIPDQASTTELCNLFRELLELNTTHLVIVGDFNMKDIDWIKNISGEGPSHFSQQLLACTQECFMFQHVTNPTRSRLGNISSTLNLIFSNEEAIVQDLVYSAPLGLFAWTCTFALFAWTSASCIQVFRKRKA